MRYIGFNIKSFKGIRDIRIDFDRKPDINIFTFVGLNESGKTTILEAMSFFSQEHDKTTHTYIPKSKKHNFNEPISVEARINLTPEDQKLLSEFLRKTYSYTLIEPMPDFSITKEHAFKNSIPTNITVTWAGKVKIRTKSKKKEKFIDLADPEFTELQIFLKQQLPVIIYYPNFLFDIPEKLYLQNVPTPAAPAQQSKDKTKEGKTRSFFIRVLQDILDYMNEKLSIDDHIVARFKARDKSPGEREALDAQLLKMSSKMNRVIFAAWKEIFPNSKPKQIDLDIAADADGRQLPRLNKTSFNSVNAA